MNHGLMTGMFWGGVLLSAFPVLLGLGVLGWVVHHQRLERRRARATSAERGAFPKPMRAGR